MTKSELIALYARARGRKRKEAEADLNFILDTISDCLAENEKVVLTGFGTFEVRNHKAKRCLNPRSHEPIMLPAGKVPGFRSGKGLKDAVNQKAED